MQKNFADYPDLVKRLLKNRGIVRQEEIEDFLFPSYDEHTHDPFLMKGMKPAVERIVRAVKNKEKIAIFSDYDADGVPGAVVLHDFLLELGHKKLVTYIPHRYKEGYGMNRQAVDYLKNKKVNLIVTVDCGIADLKEVAYANQLGIEVIITDHHLPLKRLPAALAILNPKQKDCSYPFDMLCGAGVVYKLVQAMVETAEFDFKKGREKWLLDMVGIATLSDMVPLVGENRVFAYYGLKVLRKSPRIGLLRLLRKMKINRKYLTEDDVGFMIAPRINSASRMGESTEAFRLLSSKDETEADLLSCRLQLLNDERKGLVASMIKEAKKKMRLREDGGKEILVLGNTHWRPGLLGLAANTLMESTGKTVFLWGREGTEVIKGSCRSNGSVDLVKLMSNCGDIFIDQGGHSFSGGFSIKNEDIHLLEESLIQALSKTASLEKATPLSFDDSLSLRNVTAETSGFIEQLAPFGTGNPKPVFLFKGLEIIKIKQFGKTQNHIELRVREKEKIVSAIGFFMTSKSFNGLPEEGRVVNLLASIEKTMFRGFSEIRLRIVDIQKA